MELNYLRKEEKASLLLSELYAGYGYKKYRVNTFEEYGMYLENKNFLTTTGIITFNADGRLLALRPDVTLSIVKNTKAAAGNTEKLYYQENVYRLQRESNEFKEISQTGVEVIGDIDEVAKTEITSLALQSLSTISDEFILVCSHIGFVSALFADFSVDEETEKELYRLLKEKNVHDLQSLISSGKLSSVDAERFSRLVSIGGKPADALDRLKSLATTEETIRAYGEMTTLFADIPDRFDGKLAVDFSIVNDIGYYNGIIFQGFVRDVPKPILSGGQYDLLLQKLGKASGGAIGFALYLGELSSYFPVSAKIDAVVLYRDGCDKKKLSEAADILRKMGRSVRLSRTIPSEPFFKKLYSFDGDNLSEVNL